MAAVTQIGHSPTCRGSHAPASLHRRIEYPRPSMALYVDHLIDHGAFCLCLANPKQVFRPEGLFRTAPKI
jgi:hypothetical protein